MELNSFLTRIIDDGIRAARRDYAHKPDRLRGALAGFEACRGKTPEEIANLLAAARTATRDAQLVPQRDSTISYWEIRCREAEIEWVANCLSAALAGIGLRTIITPTARGYMKAAEVLGVRGAPVA
jgi:hypothetical protein